MTLSEYLKNKKYSPITGCIFQSRLYRIPKEYELCDIHNMLKHYARLTTTALRAFPMFSML